MRRRWRAWLRIVFILTLALTCRAVEPVEPIQWVLWAWERPEDLRFVPPGVEIAVQSAFIELSGAQVRVRGRPFPLLANPAQVTTAVVHVQIDRRRPLDWSAEREAELAAAILDFARPDWVRRLQVDFEVRASEREILLGVLHAVRRGLPSSVPLSMTAIASWCAAERWVDAAPVDEVVPMLFRMGPSGRRLKERLAAGRELGNPKCGDALAVATDEPLVRLPTGRRVYVFNPRSWTADDFDAVRRRQGTWSGER